MRLLAWLLLFAPESAFAVPTCTANPFLGTNLRDCLGKIDAGGTIFLADGEHKADNFKIGTPVVIRAVNPGKARVTYGGVLLVDLLKSIFNLGETYLLDTTSLFVVNTKGARVRFEGVQFLPPVYDLTADRVPLTVGRVFQVVDSKLEIVNCSLFPEDDDADGVEDAWQVQSTDGPAADPSGGILVYGGTGAEVLLSGGFYRGVQGDHLVGTLVYLAGRGASITVEGPLRLEDSISGTGQIAILEGATGVVRASGTGAPTFERNDGDFGGVLHVGFGSSLTVEGGSFLSNRARREGNEAMSVGGVLGVSPGGTLNVKGGLFRANAAAVGGAVGGINAVIAVTGGKFEFNTARFGGHLAVLEDREQGGAASLAVDQGTWTGGRAELTDIEREENEAQGQDVYTALGGTFGVAGGVSHLQNLTVDDGFSEGAGGALAIVGGTVEVEAVRIQDSVAPVGAAIASWAGELRTLRTEFEFNGDVARTSFGGAVAVLGGAWADETSVFANNAADRGGGFSCATASSCTLSGTVVTGNQAREGGGGWLVVDSATLAEVQFVDNTAVESGGHLAAGAGTLEDGSIVSGRLTFEGGEYRGGRAGVSGGAWSLVDTDTTVTGVYWAENRAAAGGGIGGGVFASGGQLSIQQGTWVGNEADVGGGLLAVASQVDVSDGIVDSNRARQGAGLVLAGGGGSVVRQRFCGNQADEAGSALLLSRGSSGSGDLRVVNNLIDGFGGAGSGLVVVQGRTVTLEQNNVVRALQGAILATDAEIVARRNLVAWPGGELAIALERSSVDSEENLFFDPDRAPDTWISGQSSPPEAVLGDPRLRGYLGTVPEGCTWDDHHPRPNSPLLMDGWPTDPAARHIGVFGGPERVLEPWLTDADVDGAPRLFDCDDRDETVPERLVQYVDLDEDGVGGELWSGDDCELVPGNVREGGDCNDQDPTRTELCPEMIRYYGASCAASPSGRDWTAFLALSLMFVRRGRRLV